MCVGIISYKTNNSYALFSDSVTGTKTIEVEAIIDKCYINEANEPKLDTQSMIPVYYDETNEVWKKADSTNSNYNWYDYCKKKWANSVTVSSTNRSTYLNADPGIEIDMDDILTMQVWIPRYKYKVWNYNADGTAISEPQQIEITWEEGTSKTGEISCTDSLKGYEDGDDIYYIGYKLSETCKIKSTNATCTDSTCNNKTYTHPAFTFGDEELTGFWMGKFEISAPQDDACYTTANETNCNKTGITPLVKPEVMSYRYAQVGTFETNMMAMNDNKNIYGLKTTTDTHMAKNSEWGAVTYLSHSKYGTCTDGTCREVNINNSSSYYTGRSGGNVSGSTPINETYTNQTSTEQYNTYGFYTYDGYLLNYNTNTKSTTKDIKKIASTTGNIYGVYDMSGGAYEYTMANIVSDDSSTMMSGYSTTDNSGYTGIVYCGNGDPLYCGDSYTGLYSYPANKYIDKYSFINGTGTSSKSSKLGEGIKETREIGDILTFTNAEAPWFTRCDSAKDTAIRDIFESNSSSGHSNIDISSRLIILS